MSHVATTDASPGRAAAGTGTAEPGIIGDGTTTGHRLTRRLRRVAPLLGIAALLLVTALVSLALLPSTSTGVLDPEDATPQGARALAQVLADQGVQVTRTDRLAAAVAGTGPGDTLLITDPSILAPDQLRSLRDTGADLVLAAPDAVALTELAPDVVLAGAEQSTDPVAARCPDADAQAAGPITGGGVLYDTTGDAADQGAVACYPRGGGAYLVRTDTGSAGSVTVLGATGVLTNGALADQGNAALAMRLLGGGGRLTWYLPQPLDVAGSLPEDDAASAFDLLPDWVVWVMAQAAVVAAALALWQGRRLGRLVPEALPVLVRAAETTEGRARLYRRSGALDSASQALRDRAGRQLRLLLAAPRSASPDAVAAAVADRTGRPHAQVRHLLLGPTPTSDTHLVRLADDLDQLISSVQEDQRP